MNMTVFWATVLLMHVTVISVTIYLHRTQTHGAIELNSWVSHFFRFWLWLTTGMVTREWVAVHRKHHATVETEEDPHSPKQKGFWKVLFLGWLLYRKEAANPETLAEYGHGTPDDWVERNIYSKHQWGVVLMLFIDVLLFGALGLVVWFVQMATIPLGGAGVINGIGHHLGYRNYKTEDASRNILPFGLILGGEELHNNHHHDQGSAKFSRKWWEFDVSWLYIRILEFCRLCSVKRPAIRAT